MEELKQRAKKLFFDVDSMYVHTDIEEQETELRKLHHQMAEADFWQDNAKAQTVSKQAADLERKIGPWLKLHKSAKELTDLAELADSSMQTELERQLVDLENDYEELKEDLKFKGPYDDHDVVLSIYAGAGGTDAQDWAEMLLRMYTRWAEKNNLHVSTLDQSAGEEAGIKSATIRISGGDFLYGKLAGESGVHRLVRLSPFNTAHSRETSFAKVEILPLIERPDEVLIDEKDLKIDVFRAGGHGGQSVNTTDSAVRVTHMPTGISVAIQNERSQLQNKETALAILRSRLAALQLQQHVNDLAELKGPSKSTEFGSQDRNYVLHPYKQVRDLRTGYETSDVEGVLNGNLDPFINAWLQKV
ncbi:MAG TPA: peptide chain release factor 2 [Candidatus Saccharimonadales bacterium]|nr:peptide chain release factor 2 [Candidatus Saccharimonadales bacterium]